MLRAWPFDEDGRFQMLFVANEIRAKLHEGKKYEEFYKNVLSIADLHGHTADQKTGIYDYALDILKTNMQVQFAVWGFFQNIEPIQISKSNLLMRVCLFMDMNIDETGTLVTLTDLLFDEKLVLLQWFDNVLEGDIPGMIGAVFIALKNNQTNVANWIVNEHNLQEDIDEQLIEDAGTGNSERIELMMKNVRFSLQPLVSAIEAASDKIEDSVTKIKVVTLLEEKIVYHTWSESEEEYDKLSFIHSNAFISASKRDDSKMVDYMIKNNRLSKETIERALYVAPKSSEMYGKLSELSSRLQTMVKIKETLKETYIDSAESTYRQVIRAIQNTPREGSVAWSLTEQTEEELTQARELLIVARVKLQMAEKRYDTSMASTNLMRLKNVPEPSNVKEWLKRKIENEVPELLKAMQKIKEIQILTPMVLQETSS